MNQRFTENLPPPNKKEERRCYWASQLKKKGMQEVQLPHAA